MTNGRQKAKRQGVIRVNGVSLLSTDKDAQIMRLERAVKLLRNKAHERSMENYTLRKENELLKETIEHVRKDAKRIHGVL